MGQVRREIESCAASHEALRVHLGATDAVDPGAASALPGWTIGHVLTHVARNGDSHLDMLAGRPQYPSREARDGDVEAGAARPWDELVADVARAGEAVDAAYATLPETGWSGAARTLGGDRPAAMLPLLRQREVEIHRIDLGLGYGFGDLPADYVRRDLRLMTMLWTARQPMGLTGLPPAALALDPAARLAWLMGRIEVDGLDPAAIF